MLLKQTLKHKLLSEGVCSFEDIFLRINFQQWNYSCANLKLLTRIFKWSSVHGSDVWKLFPFHFLKPNLVYSILNNIFVQFVFLFLSARVRVFSPILYVLNAMGTSLQTQASWECLRIMLPEFLMQSNPSTQKVPPGPRCWPSILTKLSTLKVSWVPRHTWALFSLELTFSPDLPHFTDVKAVCVLITKFKDPH